MISVTLGGTSARLLAASAAAIAVSAAPAWAASIVLVEARDGLGRPIAGATATLEDAAGRAVASARTDAAGRASLAAPADGTFLVKVEAGGFRPGTAIAVLPRAEAVAVTLAAVEALELKLQAARLDRARNALSPETGSSTYRLDRQAIKQLPRGENAPLSQVLLQAPGVAQGTYGQLFVRGDHANLQYRLNGVIIPEGITGFGSTLDTRFVDRVDFLTGALPAQYGYRTTGVVNLETKRGARMPGGRLGFQAGTNGNLEPSAQWGGSAGATDWYAVATGLRSDLGVDAYTADQPNLHNRTQQGKGFVYASTLLDPTTRASAIAGSAVQHYQVPNVPGQTPAFRLAGTPPKPSAELDAAFQPTNHYAVAALQGISGGLDWQVATFARRSTLAYLPDSVGDLQYGGVEANVFRGSTLGGLQADAGWPLGADHTVRFGTFLAADSAVTQNRSRVFPVDASGGQAGDTPIAIHDDNAVQAYLGGLYVQDEWRPLAPLTVNYGLRYDRVAGFLDTDQLGPRLGLVWEAGPATTLHAGYARYFTPPTTELIPFASLEKFRGTTNAVATEVSATVVPERAHYVDVGVLQKLTPEAAVGLDGYLKEVDDLQDEGQFGRAPVYSTYNYARGRIMGLELTTSYKRDDLSLYANAALSRATGRGLRSGQFNFAPVEIAFIAANDVVFDHDQLFSASGGISKAFFGTTVGANALYGSGLPRGFMNAERLPAYLQLDLTASRELALPWIGPIDAQATVVNALDAVYLLRDGSGIGIEAPQYGPRRALYVGVSRTF